MAKKLFSLTLVLCMALTMVASMPALAAEPVNMVKNPGFENGVNDDGKTPKDWRRVNSGYEFMGVVEGAAKPESPSAGMYLINDKDTAHSGEYCLYFHQADSKRLGVDFNSPVGKTYKVSVWIKAANDVATSMVPKEGGGYFYKSVRPYFNVSYVDGSNYPVSGSSLEHFRSYEVGKTATRFDWLNYECYMTVPDAATLGISSEQVKVSLGISMKGAVNGTSADFYLDDVVITEYCDGAFSPLATTADALEAGKDVTITTLYTERFLASSTLDTTRELIYATYSMINGVKRLEDVEVKELDMKVSDKKSVGGYKNDGYTGFSGAGKLGEGDEGRYWGMPQKVNQTISIPADAENVRIEVFTWDTLTGLKPAGISSVIGGTAK